MMHSDVSPHSFRIEKLSVMSEEEGELFFQINKVPDEDSKGSKV